MDANEVLFESAGIVLQPTEQTLFDRYTQLVRKQLSDQVFNTLKSDRRKMKFDETGEFKLAELRS